MCTIYLVHKLTTVTNIVLPEFPVTPTPPSKPTLVADILTTSMCGPLGLGFDLSRGGLDTLLPNL